MNSELQNNRCNACGAEKTLQIVLPLGHQANECPQCGLVWSNSNTCFDQLYNSVYKKKDCGFTYDSYLQSYERLKCGGHVNLIWFEKAFLERKIPPSNGRLLEVGCSIGRFLLACKKAKWNVSGIDISEEAVKLARQVVPDIDVRCGVLTAESWPAEAFHSIVAWEVIEHMENPFEMLCAARKLLRPEGELVLSTPDWGSWFIRHNLKESYWPPIHVWFITEKSLSLLLKRAGLKIVSVQRKPIPWGETYWSKWKRILALPWLMWLGIVLRQGGGRLIVIAKKA